MTACILPAPYSLALTTSRFRAIIYRARLVPQKPIHDTIHTSIFGVGTVKIADCVKLTMQHIANA